jgi:hypothetical protein
MKIIYAPKGEPEQPFDLDSDDLDTDEAEAIEGAGGEQWDTFGVWVNQINRGGWRASRVALWVLLRRTNPSLAFEEFRPRVSEVRLRPDEEPELAEGEEPGKSETDDESTDSP